MATAAYQATIEIQGTPNTVIHDIQAFDLPFKMAMIDVTSLSAPTPGTEQYIPGLLGSQIKCNGFWNKADAGQAALETAFFGRTQVSLIASPDGGTHTYAFSAWIADYEIKSDVKSANTVDFTLQLNGGVTLV